jgi:hypothetical protein
MIIPSRLNLSVVILIPGEKLWLYISTLELSNGISSDLFRFTFNPHIFENSFNILIEVLMEFSDPSIII